MLFRDALSPSRDDAVEADSLRALWPTVAEPLAFATPLELKEDEDAFTVLFDVANRTEQDLEVEVDGRTLFIFGGVMPRGRSRPLRVWRAFALPADVDATTARMSLASRVLKVSLAKSSTGARRNIPVCGG